jgi:hypothetical protein
LLIIFAALASALTVFLFTPWWPWQPAAGLDPSWAYAINEAVAGHLVFGRDFIWTFGPFGAVDTSLVSVAKARFVRKTGQF